MKPDRAISDLFRQLRPALPSPNLGYSHFRSLPQFAALHQISRSQRLGARAFQQPYPLRNLQSRYNSTAAAPLTPTVVDGSDTEPAPTPTYELTFTCKPCLHRSKHRVTHQGYNHGTVIITCPGCTNRHVFADHLKIFEDKAFTIEDLMREKGGQFKRGTLGGDMEFWNDGTKTEREKL